MSFNFVQLNSTSIQYYAPDSFLNIFVRSFWNWAVEFILIIFFLTWIWKKSNLVSIEGSVSRPFGILAFFVLGSYITFVFPLNLFNVLLLFRWAAFGSIFMSVITGVVLIALFIQVRKKRLRTLVIIIVLLLSISSFTLSSPASAPFKDDHFGVAPRPYLLPSEEVAASYAASEYTGLIITDQVLRYYFYYEKPISLVGINASANMFQNIDGGWLLRKAELTDRGLIFTQGLTYVYKSEQDLSVVFNNLHGIQVVDTGSTAFLIITNS